MLSSFLGHKNGPSHQELKIAKFLRRKSARIWQCQLKYRDWNAFFSAKLSSSNVKTEHLKMSMKVTT